MWQPWWPARCKYQLRWPNGSEGRPLHRMKGPPLAPPIWAWDAPSGVVSSSKAVALCSCPARTIAWPWEGPHPSVLPPCTAILPCLLCYPAKIHICSFCAIHPCPRPIRTNRAANPCGPSNTTSATTQNAAHIALVPFSNTGPPSAPTHQESLFCALTATTCNAWLKKQAMHKVCNLCPCKHQGWHLATTDAP